MVPFLSYKSCTADTILSSIILPLENTSTCTICQPRPLWGRRSLCCLLVPRVYIHWNHSIISAFSPCCFWQNCKGLLRFSAQDPSNVGFKNERRTGMGGVTATDFKFLSLALLLTKHCQCHKVLLLWFFAPGSVAASRLEGEGCQVGAKAAFHPSPHSERLQAFLRGGNHQINACLLVSLVAKDYFQWKQDSSHCEQCASWAVLWCLTSEKDFANKLEEEVVVLYACVFVVCFCCFLLTKPSFFLCVSHFYCTVVLLVVTSVSFCCLLDTH